MPNRRVSTAAGTTVAVTATADGLTTGLIPDGAGFVSVTSANADHIITLPVGAVGQQIRGWIGANGCEVRTVASSNDTINGQDADGTKEAALPATTLFKVTCVAAETWVLEATDELGAVVTAIVPD